MRSIVFYAFYIGSFAICQDQGLDNFNSERFLEAQNYYDSILLEDSNNPKAHYGKGSSEYMLENYDNAQTSYNEALNTSEDKLRAKALYNLGNISFKNNKLEEALALYRKALELDPFDDEARYNYEYIKYQKSPPEEKNNDDNSEKEQDENKEKEKEEEGNKNEEDKKDSEDEKDQNDEKKDQENNEDKKQEESNQNDDSSMNDEESEQQPQNQKKSQDLKKAESILDAIKNDEKVMQKQLIQKAKTKKLLKDW